MKVRFCVYKLSRVTKKLAKSRNFLPAKLSTFKVVENNGKITFYSSCLYKDIIFALSRGKKNNKIDDGAKTFLEAEKILLLCTCSTKFCPLPNCHLLLAHSKHYNSKYDKGAILTWNSLLSEISRVTSRIFSNTPTPLYFCVTLRHHIGLPPTPYPCVT